GKGKVREAYRELDGRWCTRRFYVCRSCFRGQAYCGDACAAEGYRAVQDEARARHLAGEEVAGPRSAFWTRHDAIARLSCAARG
ncbi:MAG TPA: hypothetical protein PLI95_28090, partial [Polyangiaceae bacterium]|nr:hypothetical protein [Polyangiaceae bacterium]